MSSPVCQSMLDHGQERSEGAMKSVLMDGSTIVFVAELLENGQQPDASNVFDLANVIEALILHEKIVVLDTAHPKSEPSERLLAACELIGKGVIRIKNWPAQWILEEYLTRERPDFPELVKSGAFERAATCSDFSKPVGKIGKLLLEQYDEEVKDYK